MMKVKVVELMGYDGWNVEGERMEEVEEWSVKGVVDMWMDVNDWGDEEVREEIREDMMERMVVCGGVMSLMGEECGEVFVLLEEGK